MKTYEDGIKHAVSLIEKETDRLWDFQLKVAEIVNKHKEDLSYDNEQKLREDLHICTRRTSVLMKIKRQLTERNDEDVDN